MCIRDSFNTDETGDEEKIVVVVASKEEVSKEILLIPPIFCSLEIVSLASELPQYIKIKNNERYFISIL